MWISKGSIAVSKENDQINPKIVCYKIQVTIFVEIGGNKVEDAVDAVSYGKLIFGFFGQSAVNVLKEDLDYVRKAIGSGSAYQDQSVHTSILIEIAECEGGVKASCSGSFGCEAGLCIVRQTARG